MQERQIKCTPFRFPTAGADDDSEEDECPENEDVPMINVEKLDPSPETKIEIETHEKEADEQVPPSQRSGVSMHDDDEQHDDEDEEQEGEDSESFEEEMDENDDNYGETDSW